MFFSEEQLRAALKRIDPGEPFTNRVMARVTERHAQAVAVPGFGRRFLEVLSRLRAHPALASVLVVVLLMGGSLAFVRYRHAQERRAGEAAKQQALLALRITTAKLNHVLERVRPAPAP